VPGVSEGSRGTYSKSVPPFRTRLSHRSFVIHEKDLCLRRTRNNDKNNIQKEIDQNAKSESRDTSFAVSTKYSGVLAQEKALSLTNI
jgi:hypothetical protein